jgi:AcrR family transcriptional regulator
MTDRDQALIDAVVEETIEVGTFDLSVERVSARAGISQSEFHERFSDERAAVDAAHEVLFERFVDRLLRVCDAQPNWPLKVKAGIGLALDLTAASPVRARFLMLDPPIADRDLILKAIESRDRLARLLAAGRSETPNGSILPAITEQVLVAGVWGVILARLAGGEAEHLPALAPQLVELTLIPYLGRGEAAEVARRPRPRVEGG